MTENHGLSNGKYSIQVRQCFTFGLFSSAVNIVLLDVVKTLLISLKSDHIRILDD